MQRIRSEIEFGAFLSSPFEGSAGHMGIGWRFALGIGWDRIPVTLGIDCQSAYFGKSNSRGVVIVGNEALEIDKSRTDSAVFLSVYARLQPPYWPVRPYVEGLAGPKRLRTDYTVEFVGGTGSAEVTTDDHWTYTLGVGAGVDLPLGSRLWLTCGVRYLAGGVASYSRAVPGDRDAVIHYTTSTTIKTFSLGLAGRFGDPKHGR